MTKIIAVLLCVGLLSIQVMAQQVVGADSVAANAKPWVFWYWMQASVSREGITADLGAMKEAGIGGAYLMPIKGPATPPLMQPPVEQLSAEWWQMVRHAFTEADRMGLQLGMHASDGFAVAGGPWITPDLAMQKVVWTETHIKGRGYYDATLPQPPSYNGYYRDIAVLAYPTPEGTTLSTYTTVPGITTSLGQHDASFLVKKDHQQSFRSDEACWIQYTFDAPFTCRTITIRTGGNNYQAHRLIVEVSDDGKTFRTLGRLQPPRHGWQDTDADVTHTIPETTAKIFRFRYDKTGSEPGSEDLDAAKWKPSLKIKGIDLSGAPRLYQYEGKTGAVWRISPRTTTAQLPDALCIPRDSIINITEYLQPDGHLGWTVPPGNWTILRIGHTATGHTNYTGGAGKGLECDKFNTEAVKLQFDRWFGEAVRQAGTGLATRVLKMFHVDSWECGSQNWSPVLAEEFKKRRGYDLMPYLPAMAGIPVQSADVSERFLYDVRQTITELVHDNFYGTLKTLAHSKGCTFTAESVAPTMTGDGMLHYNNADVPMGEFWLNSPTHDKPNDMLDAISGAHVYGKPLVQAEAFTTVRMAWNEHPAMLKALGDRNYALGINRLVYHVFTHNPWFDRKPGMTLDGVGLFFQRDQTWWKPGRAWVEYARRCQQLLQQGTPVTDVAVFTGEALPRRAILPDRLVPTLPGIFGEAVVASERLRLANAGEPLREQPEGVTHAANMADPWQWVDPLRGYAYDSFNKDALLRLATVSNGRIALPGGASYAMLILPAAHAMSPDTKLMSPQVAARLLQLVNDGATILINDMPQRAPGLETFPACDDTVKTIADKLFGGDFSKGDDGVLIKQLGKGRVIKGPYTADSFRALGIARDVVVTEGRKAAPGIAWTHRRTATEEIYFISNQHEVKRTLQVSLRVARRAIRLYNPVTGETTKVEPKAGNGRTDLDITLEASGAVFIIGGEAVSAKQRKSKKVKTAGESVALQLEGPWQVTFSPAYGGPAQAVTFETLTSWSSHTDAGIKHYSGTAIYSHSFQWKDKKRGTRVWLDLGKVANIAEVRVNGIDCGVAWTSPYRVEITRALKAGTNTLSIEVTNTWANRLIGDHALPPEQRITNTTAPFRLEGKPPLEAGLLGQVMIGIRHWQGKSRQ